MAFQHFALNWLKHRFAGVSLGIAAIVLLGAGCTQLRQAATPSANTTTIALADHLNQTGAKMYGTYWCPYCKKQKEMFGSAITKLQIIECDPQGENAQPQLCAKANVSSFPTWEINGRLYVGMRSLEELALLSGYQGAIAPPSQ